VRSSSSFLIFLTFAASFEEEHKIDRSSSPDQVEIAIDVASDRIRERAVGMSPLDEPFSGLLADASNGFGKRAGEQESSCFISAKVDPGDDVDIVISKALAGIPAHMKEGIFKTGCLAAGEELLRIGRIAFSAEGPGARRA
jgi:hypothetical protein